jgi:Tol biopolymer transport system component
MKKTFSLALVLALGLTIETANADFAFGTPTNLGPPVNSVYGERSPSISADGLELYFYDWQNPRPGGYGRVDLWVATRATKDDLWGEPVNLGPLVNSSARDQTPDISADGLSLYFASDRPGGHGNRDIWVTTRTMTGDPWGEPVNLGPTVNSSGADRGPSISADGLSLFFHSERSGGSGSRDILVTTRETTDDDWGVPVNLGPIVNCSIGDSNADISADGLWLFFQSSSDRPVWNGEYDLWATIRDTIDDEWGTPVNLGPTVNSSNSEDSPDISADGSTLFFSSNNRPGGVGDSDIWQVSIEPIVDLNGDGIVDAADMSIIVDYWGTDEPLCDIGPMPWGDGIVDVQDLIVLAGHLFEEIPLAEPVE